MKNIVSLFCLALLLATASFALAADTLHFVIMSSEDPKKEGPKYNGFIPTSAADFSHTFEIFEKANINAKTFDFKF